jgi:uncharacterized protein YecE (DUF72 family)
MIYAGTSNPEVPERNKSLYPEAFRDASKLTYYASLFNSVEINATFKKLPMKRTIEKWAASVPGHFRFTFKLNSAITHSKALAFNPDDLFSFISLINVVEEKKGCLLMQFPGKLDATYTLQLENLLRHLKEVDPLQQWKPAIEFRNGSWYQPETFELLNNYNTAIVIHDMPGSAITPDYATDNFIYLRFHGTEKGYRGSYADEVLSNYAAHIKRWNAQGKPVYLYFNNTLGNAANNLVTLKRMLG